MDAIERREILQPLANPGGGRDYVVTLRDEFRLKHHRYAFTLILRYVPDRHVLDLINFRTYLEGLSAIKWETREEAAVAILSDVANELIPRWAQVTMRFSAETPPPLQHEICIEESQPGWRNDDLLYRLPPV